MITRRSVAVLFAAFVMTVGVASASALGTFSDIAFSAFADERTPCTYDDVSLLDGTLDLVTGTILPSSDLETVALTNLTGECAGLVPVVVVYGVDLTDLAAGEQRLLLVDQFEQLDGGGDKTLTVSPPIPLGDDIVAFYTFTRVRVAFCPAGATCT